jgi:hypothetical protein
MFDFFFDHPIGADRMSIKQRGRETQRICEMATVMAIQSAPDIGLRRRRPRLATKGSNSAA